MSAGSGRAPRPAGPASSDHTATSWPRPRKYSTQANESRTRSNRASGLMGLVPMREPLHVGMGPEPLSRRMTRSLEESPEELVKRLRFHPLLEMLELVVEVLAHLNRCRHSAMDNTMVSISRFLSDKLSKMP